MEPTQIKEFRARISRAIRMLRKEEGISSEFLAKVLGVTQPTISRIENGSTSISAERLCFLAKSFNRPLSFFIGEKSQINVDEKDIINAGLVFYGALHLKSKSNIYISQYYNSYPEFLNAVLKFSDNTRISTAIGATIFQQALKDNLKPLQILPTVTHPRLQANLYKISEITSNACNFVQNYNSNQIKSVKKRINRLKVELNDELSKLNNFANANHAAKAFISINITPQQVAKFLDEC